MKRIKREGGCDGSGVEEDNRGIDEKGEKVGGEEEEMRRRSRRKSS